MGVVHMWEDGWRGDGWSGLCMYIYTYIHTPWVDGRLGGLGKSGLFWCCDVRWGRDVYGWHWRSDVWIL